MFCKICGSEIFDEVNICPKCWSPVEETIAPPKPQPPKTIIIHEQKKQKHTGRTVLTVFLVLVLLLGISAFTFIILKDNNSKAAEKETLINGVSISENLFDFEFILSGKKYFLPCHYDLFTENGWELYSSDYSEDSVIEVGTRVCVNMKKDNSILTLVVYNSGTEDSSLSDCSVGGLCVKSSSISSNNFSVAKNISLGSTPKEVQAAFGECEDETNENEKGFYLSYASPDSEDYFAEFSFSEETSCDEIYLCNFKLSKYTLVKTDSSSTDPVSVSLNQKCTVDGAFEITLNSAEWADTVLPSNTSGKYYYYNDVEGETYFVVRGTAKNISGYDVDLEYNAYCNISVNNEDAIKGAVAVESSGNNDFYGTTKPSEEVNIVFYFSVPDDQYNAYGKADVSFGIINNADAFGTNSNNQYDYDNFIIRFKG